MSISEPGAIIKDNFNLPYNREEQDRQVNGYIRSLITDLSATRAGLESSWMEAWAHYLGTPYGMDFLRSRVLHRVGEVNDDWRHKLNVGQAYQVVEDIHGYLMAATFPNEEWLHVQPLEPMYRKMARILRKFYSKKLTKWKFRSYYAAYVRQLLITGNSCMFVPWGKQGQEFEVVDVFDVLVDPTCRSIDEDFFIRRHMKTRRELLKMADKGELGSLTVKDVIFIGAHSDEDLWERDTSHIIQSFQGVTYEHSFSLNDKIFVYEFWGDIDLDSVLFTNRHVSILGKHVIEWEVNKLSCGIPYVFGTYTDVIKMPFGISPITSSLGLLHELNIVTNQRLDNLEIALNNMYTIKQGGMTTSENFRAAPGATYDVLEHDEIRPIPQDANTPMVSYSEANYLVDTVNRNSGTGPLIGQGQPRGGERVTAEEIRAVQEAGGNRLTNVFAHIEDTSLIPMITKVMHNSREFIISDEMVALPSGGDEEWYDVGPRELRGAKYNLVPRTASYIITQREYIAQRTAFIDLVMKVPEFAGKIDLDRVLMDLLENWGFEDPEAYLKQAEPSQQQPKTMFDRLGGESMKNMAIQQVAADGGANMLQKLFGQAAQGGNINDLLERTAGAQQTVAALGAPGNPSPI